MFLELILILIYNLYEKDTVCKNQFPVFNNFRHFLSNGNVQLVFAESGGTFYSKI